MRLTLSFFAGLLLPANAHALSLDDISGKDANGTVNFKLMANKAMAKFQVAKKYDQLAGKAAQKVFGALK